jgi:HPt (histidine-containing phosphotransfer) domain-containing protein
MAHAAKGAARMTGAARRAAVCSEIESCSKDEDLISALEWLALVPTAFDDVSRAIAAVIEAKS